MDVSLWNCDLESTTNRRERERDRDRDCERQRERQCECDRQWKEWNEQRTMTTSIRIRIRIRIVMLIVMLIWLLILIVWFVQICLVVHCFHCIDYFPIPGRPHPDHPNYITMKQNNNDASLPEIGWEFAGFIGSGSTSQRFISKHVCAKLIVWDLNKALGPVQSGLDPYPFPARIGIGWNDNIDNKKW
jgi:hypothetical protein